MYSDDFDIEDHRCWSKVALWAWEKFRIWVNEALGFFGKFWVFDRLGRRNHVQNWTCWHPIKWTNFSKIHRLRILMGLARLNWFRSVRVACYQSWFKQQINWCDLGAEGFTLSWIKLPESFLESSNRQR